MCQLRRKQARANPSRRPERPFPKKPPRNPLYISRRKSDGGLFYVRRLSQALVDAGLLGASTPKRIALGTKDWLMGWASSNAWLQALKRLAALGLIDFKPNPRLFASGKAAALAKLNARRADAAHKLQGAVQ